LKKSLRTQAFFIWIWILQEAAAVETACCSLPLQALVVLAALAFQHRLLQVAARLKLAQAQARLQAVLQPAAEAAVPGVSLFAQRHQNRPQAPGQQASFSISCIVFSIKMHSCCFFHNVKATCRLSGNIRYCALRRCVQVGAILCFIYHLPNIFLFKFVL
jgi:hypothetical protein